MNASEIFDRMCGAVREAGELARAKQNTVQNDPKMDQALPNENERLTAMRTAKTIIDEHVQEMLLSALLECYPAGDLLVDAEEKTSTLMHFSGNGSISVILDPIDGTLEYLEGNDSYSVCIALIENAKLTWAIVYFPARDKAYSVAPDGKAYVYDTFGANGTKHAQAIELPKSGPRVLYKTRRVPLEFEQRFLDAGFEVREWDNYVQGLLAVLTGDAVGYIACEPQIRDILIGPVIGKSSGGFMCNWQGDEIVWPQTGRLPQAFFGNAAIEKEILTILTA